MLERKNHDIKGLPNHPIKQVNRTRSPIIPKPPDAMLSLGTSEVTAPPINLHISPIFTQAFLNKRYYTESLIDQPLQLLHTSAYILPLSG